MGDQEACEENWRTPDFKEMMHQRKLSCSDESLLS